MLWIRVEAPFATFRTFTAGWYRPSASFLTPSAAYGLVLNLAGIESRLDDGTSVQTMTRPGLPQARVAIGAVGDFPTKQSLFQQLHNYPVGETGKARKDDAKGHKYNITPVRREFLSNLNACIGIDGGEDLEQRVREGLEGKHTRYGLPFLGDNNFLPDRIDLLDGPIPARWYRRVNVEDRVVPHTTRLTIRINQADLSQKKSALYAPDADPLSGPPGPDYWTTVGAAEAFSTAPETR